jgi:DNA repair photolyase
MDYDDEQYKLDNNRIPLANTANWEELCESYSEDQIRMMADAILNNRKSKLSFQDKLLKAALDESYKKTLRQRKERSDNKEYLAKQMLLNKETIIQNLLLHQSILYNPIAISR